MLGDRSVGSEWSECRVGVGWSELGGRSWVVGVLGGRSGSGGSALGCRSLENLMSRIAGPGKGVRTT